MVFGKFLSPLDDFTECHKIRREVFIEEQGVSEEDEYDGTDAMNMHLLVSDGEKYVATGRISLIDGIYKISRVAVLKSERGKYYGDFAVRMLCDRAFQNGAQSVFINSQTHAVRFYKSIGFEEIGDEFMEAGIPHVKMELKKCKFTSKCGNCGGCH